MLKIENINYNYDNKKVLSAFSMHVRSSDNYLVTGNSGSGKTTLLYLIAGLLKNQNGSILFNDNDISKYSETELDEYRKNNIGIIFQETKLIRSLSVLDNILLAQKLTNGRIDKVKAVELLSSLNLEDEVNKLPDNLSFGQKQRAGIARSIIHSPKIILADEPTSGLDDENADATIKLLLEISETHGSSLIVATHDARIKGYFQNTINLSE